MSSNLRSSITVPSHRTCELLSVACLHVPCSGLSTRCLSEWVNSPAIHPCRRTQFDPPPGLVAGLLNFLFVLYVTVHTATFFRATVCGHFIFFVSSAKLPFECHVYHRTVTSVCRSLQCHCKKPPPSIHCRMQGTKFKLVLNVCMH